MLADSLSLAQRLLHQAVGSSRCPGGREGGKEGKEGGGGGKEEEGVEE